MNWLQELHAHYKPQPGIANIFGVILYTDAHAHIKKVLADAEYWDAFDEISGPQWAVFSIRAIPGKYGLPAPSSPSTLSFLVPVWKEPSANKELLQFFCVNSTEKIPALVAYTDIGEGEVLQVTLGLDDSSIEAAYASIKEKLTVIAKALSLVAPENLNSALGTFQAVSLAVRNHKDMRLIKKGVGITAWIKQFIS